MSAGTLLFTIEDSAQRANTELAAANLKLARDQYDKDRAAYEIDSKIGQQGRAGYGGGHGQPGGRRAQSGQRAVAILFGQSAGGWRGAGGQCSGWRLCVFAG